MAAPVHAGSPCTDLVPPAKYLAMPKPQYRVEIIASIEALTRICGEGVRLACAAPGIVYVLSEARDDPFSYRCLIRHEEAHLNGWAASHPVS